MSDGSDSSTVAGPQPRRFERFHLLETRFGKIFLLMDRFQPLPSLRIKPVCRLSTYPSTFMGIYVRTYQMTRCRWWWIGPPPPLMALRCRNLGLIGSLGLYMWSFLGLKLRSHISPACERVRRSQTTQFSQLPSKCFNASRSEEDLRNFEAYSLQQMLSNVGNQSVWSIIVNYKMADSWLDRPVTEAISDHISANLTCMEFD